MEYDPALLPHQVRDRLAHHPTTYATVGCHPKTLGLECARRGKSRDRESKPALF